MKDGVSRTGLRITTILVSMVVGVVAVILCCCIILFLNRYRSAMVQSAQTSTAQAVSQVSNTVGSYLQGMDQAMSMVEWSLLENDEDRDRMLTAFLIFRPDVVAVTGYSHSGELLDCWCLDREPRENIYRNLSFDLERARSTGGAYMTAPHVESIFEGYYPWVVTMTAPLEQGNSMAWVSLDLSFSSISSYINNVSIGQRGYCFLMDGEGGIVYHPQQQLLYAGLKTENSAALAALEDGSYADDTVIRRLLCRRHGYIRRHQRSGQRLAGGGCQLCGRAGKPQRQRYDTPDNTAGGGGASGGPAHQLAAVPAAGPAPAGPGRGHGEL